MEFDELKQLVESNAKSIEALSNESAVARQELREGLKETRAIIDSNAKAILGLAEEARADRQDILDLKDTVFTLAQIASDREKRLTQFVGYSITGDSDRLDLLQRIQKLERRIKQIEDTPNAE